MCKRYPRELFLFVQIGLVGLLPCIVSAGLKRGVECTVEALGMLSFNGFFSTIKREKNYQIVVEKMIPEGMNYSVHVIL